MSYPTKKARWTMTSIMRWLGRNERRFTETPREELPARVAAMERRRKRERMAKRSRNRNRRRD